MHSVRSSPQHFIFIIGMLGTQGGGIECFALFDRGQNLCQHVDMQNHLVDPVPEIRGFAADQRCRLFLAVDHIRDLIEREPERFQKADSAQACNVFAVQFARGCPAYANRPDQSALLIIPDRAGCQVQLPAHLGDVFCLVHAASSSLVLLYTLT